MVTKQLPFRETINALNEVELREPCPITGYITDVLMHFPEGCNSLVEIAVDYEGRRVCPRGADEYIALNNATEKFKVDYPVKSGRPVIVIVRNFDALNSHTPSIILCLEEAKLKVGMT